MNGLHFLVFAATVFGAVFFIPRAFAADRLWRELDSLDSEELAAYVEQYPDVLDWKGWR
jgi:hypothetical protein